MNVMCYVDGFNLYHGLRTKGWKKYYWLDVWALAERFLRPGQILAGVAYCTARIKSDPDGVQRQADFIDALVAHRPGVKVIYGHYLAKKMQCFHCGHSYLRPEEKMTDVNIACHMLADAMDDRFDVALLMSADSDLVPPVQMVRSRWPEKKVIAVFPPNRRSDALKKAVHGRKRISEADVRQSLLPEKIVTLNGQVMRRPESWR